MAVDEVLLDLASHQGNSTLRFYSWTDPTLSLGYFQSYQDREEHPPSLDCACVRRMTGGGAILHDRELTYSFAAAVTTLGGGNGERLYRIFHETLVAALRDFGVAAALCSSPSPLQPEPFLCFQRRAAGDVLLKGWKIAGSAQRRRKQGILQHGSVLLGTSPHAPELPGLSELTDQDLTAEEIISRWTEHLAKREAVSWKLKIPSLDHIEPSKRVAFERYGTRKWTYRR
jgi:lipoate-protein ligase A